MSSVLEHLASLALEFLRVMSGDTAARQDDAVRRFLSNASNKSKASLLLTAAVAADQCHSGIRSTQRDLYYRHPQLFGSQSQAERSIATLVALLNTFSAQPLSRESLMFAAAGKSVVAGSVLEYVVSGPTARYTVSLPQLRTNGVVIATEAAFDVEDFMLVDERGCHVDETSCVVLIVEKEATFQHLIRHERILEKFRVVAACGKGYPCVALRTWLTKLSCKFPSMRLFALVDGDPHGIAILTTYIFGAASSTKLKKASASALLPVQLLGVRQCMLASMPADQVMQLTAMDTNKALHLAELFHQLLAPLQQNVACSLVEDVYTELRLMLESNRKAELQALPMTFRDDIHDIFSSLLREACVAACLTLH